MSPRSTDRAIIYILVYLYYNEIVDILELNSQKFIF